MTTDYGKKKNAELEELLKARSLPHTGKKAELVARLQQDDKTSSSASKSTTSNNNNNNNKKPTAPLAPEDEIDWEDDGTTIITSAPTVADPTPRKAPAKPSVKAPASTPTAATALAAGGLGAVPTPTSVPNQTPAIDPSQTSDLTVSAPSKDPPPPPPQTFTSHLPSTTLTTELEKRERRAARFGIPTTTTSTTSTTTPTALTTAEADKKKALERAKKFGTGEQVISALDQALPERGTKRGRGGEQGGRSSSKRGRGAGKGNMEGEGDGGREKSVEGGKGKGKGDGGRMEKDRLAAEARKKRFATAA